MNRSLSRGTSRPAISLLELPFVRGLLPLGKEADPNYSRRPRRSRSSCVFEPPLGDAARGGAVRRLIPGELLPQNRYPGEPCVQNVGIKVGSVGPSHGAK